MVLATAVLVPFTNFTFEVAKQNKEGSFAGKIQARLLFFSLVPSSITILALDVLLGVGAAFATFLTFTLCPPVFKFACRELNCLNHLLPYPAEFLLRTINPFPERLPDTNPRKEGMTGDRLRQFSEENFPEPYLNCVDRSNFDNNIHLEKNFWEYDKDNPVERKTLAKNTLIAEISRIVMLVISLISYPAKVFSLGNLTLKTFYSDCWDDYAIFDGFAFPAVIYDLFFVSVRLINTRAGHD
jgi:hypothetical protein